MADAMHPTILDAASHAAALELARRQGGTVDESVARALRAALEIERSRRTSTNRTLEERNRRARAWLARWHERLSNPPPLSDHSYLYDDETGLPV